MLEIAILLFNRLTALDAIGPYEVLSRLPGATVKFVGKQAGTVRSLRYEDGVLAAFSL